MPINLSLPSADGLGAATPEAPPVTFLLSDIVGSTELPGALGDGYPDVVPRSLEMLRPVSSRHGGEEADATGEVFEQASTDGRGWREREIAGAVSPLEQEPGVRSGSFLA